MLSSSAFEQRLDYIQERIHLASIKSGRNPKNITLVAITKAFPAEIWKRALRANLNTLGESRIQEAQEKSDVFLQRDKIELHFIGHLQSNKAQKAVKLFDVIQTVDSIKIAAKINEVSEKANKKQTIFIQVNISNDKNKFGVLPQHITLFIKKIKKYRFLNPSGIMTITKQTQNQSEIKKYFKKAKKIQEKIQKTIDSRHINLSMGMSNDYLLAIEAGATHVRIGSEIFGARNIE